MFEKEALYYGYHQTLGVSISEMKQSAYDWQKGAEFGYNKCKDELVVKTKEIAKEVIEYLLTSLKIEGCDLSESGCETKDYEIYRKAISLIENNESE